MCTMCLGVLRRQESLNPLEFWVQSVMSHHVGDPNLGSSVRAVSSQPLIHLPSFMDEICKEYFLKCLKHCA